MCLITRTVYGTAYGRKLRCPLCAHADGISKGSHPHPYNTTTL